ncbi:hypothetical protein [Chitinibacter sp. S2-10]|uniref:hypothetical protein n=1 Tax=Chitinibacter sp. S2-10 TaxID=3373597 RepID=UPI003977E0A8
MCQITLATTLPTTVRQRARIQHGHSSKLPTMSLSTIRTPPPLYPIPVGRQFSKP